MTATLRTLTLGCKVNQYETQLVREGLLGLGYADAPHGQPADLCVVNTCTVTAEGDSKSRQAIRRLHRQNPQAAIVVMGCYATRAPQEIEALPGVAEVITDKREIPDWLQRRGVTELPQGIRRLDGRSRAYVKVQDGCLLRCSYCIIPVVRPTMYSRPANEIVEEIRRMVDDGVREIVLTGIHLGHYGVDFSAGKPKSQWTRLANLLDRLSQLPGRFRLRISSIEATEISRELISVMKDQQSEKICPHFHVCLQSGSDRVLRRMRRRWGSRRFLDRCQLIQEQLDLPALTTDVIVGFPGETESDFQQTLEVCAAVGFSKIHAFPFSARRGTPAADLPDPVEPAVKAERMQRLGELESAMRGAYFSSLLNRPLTVLVESHDGSTASGTACRYAPVDFAAADVVRGGLYTVIARTTCGQRIQAAPGS